VARKLLLSSGAIAFGLFLSGVTSASAQVACAGSGQWRECNHGIWQAQQDAKRKTLHQPQSKAIPPGNSLKAPAGYGGIVAAGAGNAKPKPPQIIGNGGAGIIGQGGNTKRPR
jgi:hypothetical protein